MCATRVNSLLVGLQVSLVSCGVREVSRWLLPCATILLEGHL